MQPTPTLEPHWALESGLMISSHHDQSERSHCKVPRLLRKLEPGRISKQAGLTHRYAALVPLWGVPMATN